MFHKGVPEEWLYDPEYRLKNGMTTAMTLAKNKIIPPEYWNHDPILQDDYGFTVAHYLSMNNITIP